MLIFNNFGIRIYVTPILSSGPSRAVAEKVAVKSLLKEAFPSQRDLRIGHRYTGAPFLTTSKNGRPNDMAPDGRPFPAISVSHCRSMAAIAIAPPGTPIGIDCETPDRLRQLERVAPRFLSSDQLEVWSKAPAVLWAWTIKEAAYKAADRPGLDLGWIPLPMEIPLGEPTADSMIKLPDGDFCVVQIDNPMPSVLMLVYAPVESDDEDYDDEDCIDTTPIREF